MRILVVDDDSLAGEMTVAVLEGLEHECLLAENGIDALKILEADGAIEMVISDLNMPLVSGIELFREMRSQSMSMPFILLTGDDAELPLRQESRLDACVLKDFTLEDSLPQAIEEVLARNGHKSL